MAKPPNLPPEPAGQHYHITSFRHMERIAQSGLNPKMAKRDPWEAWDYEPMAKRCHGKVFVTQGLSTARVWYELLAERSRERCPKGDKACRRMVMLRVRKTSADLRADHSGNREVCPRNFYRAGCITAKCLEFWDPKHGAWQPVGRWGDSKRTPDQKYGPPKRLDTISRVARGLKPTQDLKAWRP